MLYRYFTHLKLDETERLQFPSLVFYHMETFKYLMKPTVWLSMDSDKPILLKTLINLYPCFEIDILQLHFLKYNNIAIFHSW